MSGRSKVIKNLGIAAAIFFALGIGTLILYYAIIKPKTSRHLDPEILAMFEPYRPTGQYRRNFFWKRPFLNRPLDMRRGFNEYVPDYYEPVLLEDVLSGGTRLNSDKTSVIYPGHVPMKGLRVPGMDLGSQYTIEFDFKFDRYRSDDDTLLFYNGQNEPSPMIVYSPSNNTLSIIVSTFYRDGQLSRIVPLGKIDPSKEYVKVKYVQDREWTTIEINGTKLLHTNLGWIARTGKNDSMHLLGYPHVWYKDFMIFKKDR